MTITPSILLNPPKQIPYTKKDFDNITVIGLAQLMINYRVFIVDENKDLKLYMQDYRANNLHRLLENHPKEEYRSILPGYINESSEVGWFVIPHSNPINAKLRKIFSHLIIK